MVMTVPIYQVEHSSQNEVNIMIMNECKTHPQLWQECMITSFLLWEEEEECITAKYLNRQNVHIQLMCIMNFES